MNRQAVAYTLIAAAAKSSAPRLLHPRSRWSAPALEKMVALSAGFMVSVALLDLVPEAIASTDATAGATDTWRISARASHAAHARSAFPFRRGDARGHASVSMSALVGLLLHTFVDGVAIASGFEVGASLGCLVFVAILLHKLPEGLAISSLFLAAGSSRQTGPARRRFAWRSDVIGGILTE